MSEVALKSKHTSGTLEPIRAQYNSYHSGERTPVSNTNHEHILYLLLATLATVNVSTHSQERGSLINA
jgi:hypothetical protein